MVGALYRMSLRPSSKSMPELKLCWYWLGMCGLAELKGSVEGCGEQGQIKSALHGPMPAAAAGASCLLAAVSPAAGVVAVAAAWTKLSWFATWGS